MTIRYAGALARLLTALSFLLAATGDPAAAGAALPADSSSPGAAPIAAIAGASDTADAAHCVDSSSLDLRRLLAPPPRAGSPRDRAELDELLRIQARRTSSEAELARRDAARTIFRFADALGNAPGFERERLPQTLTLFRHLNVDETAVLAPAKRDFARPRPFTVEPRLAPIVAQPMSASYPSGHSTWAYTTALVLADMVPERRAQLLARADQYARNRTVAGVHYPSDVEAGKLAGTTLAAMLFTCPAFAREEAAARKELRGALRLP
ncbi:MAG TPA: phosphatase PAP2 family protein [Steroidobacteraceae bacterium]